MTRETNQDIRSKWNQRHTEAQEIGAPARVLAEYAHLLPAAGKALDLACGRGRNAVFLAGQGLDVQAWDIADVAIEQLSAFAREHELTISAATRDVVSNPPAPNSFDVIVVTYFLERELAPALLAALKPGGLLFYQTFIQEAVSEGGPRNPAFRLAPNELLRLFADLQVLVYREEGRQGDTRRGLRNEAMLVGRRVLD